MGGRALECRLACTAPADAVDDVGCLISHRFDHRSQQLRWILKVCVDNQDLVTAAEIEANVGRWHWLTTLGFGGEGRVAQGGGGRIIAITSVHEESQAASSAPYGASKGGLRNLTRAMAVELGEHGITVNNLAPGMIVTPMNKDIVDDLEERERRANLIVMREAGYPQDIANMATFLASDAASMVTLSSR